MSLRPKSARRVLFACGWVCMAVALALMLVGGTVSRQFAMIAIVCAMGFVMRARHIDTNPSARPNDGQQDEHGPT
jgi:hypothetical protein